MIAMSLPPDAKKAYGIVTALGTKLGERARGEPTLMDDVRATQGPAALLDLVRAKTEGLVPQALVEQFAAMVSEKDWLVWRSRLLLQMRMARDGGKPAPGHEQGKGVGRP